MRLIDAEDTKKLAQEHLIDPYHIISVCAVIDKAETADVAPVVRCRECKHWKPGDFMAGDDIDHMYRGGGCPIRRFAVYENDFCSEGERRESNENQT